MFIIEDEQKPSNRKKEIERLTFDDQKFNETELLFCSRVKPLKTIDDERKQITLKVN